MSSSLTYSPVSGDVRNVEELWYFTISEGRLQKVQEMLRAGVTSNITDSSCNRTPLHYAVEMRQHDIVEELLLKEWKTDINAKDIKGNTPLHIAALQDDIHLVQLLLRKQAKIDAENYAYRTPIELAKDPRVISVLEKYFKLSMNETLFTKVPVPADGNCLFWAIALAYLYPVKQNNDVFQERLKKLFGNVSSAEFSQVRDLIQQYNPCANAADVYDNKTLLTLVAEKFRKRVVAEMSLREKEFEKFVTTYSFLCSKNKDYITGGKFQNKFQHEFSHEIIQYNIDIRKLRPDVFDKASVEIIDSELDKVPDQNQVRQFIFKSYLECMSDPAAWGGNHELQAISNILQCSMLVFSDYGKIVISHDSGNHQLQLFCNGEVHYEFGLIRGQVLIEAIKSCKIQKAKIYLNLGVDNVNHQDSEGFTALHFAASCGSAEVTQLLLNQGAKTGVRDYYGKTPSDIALLFKNDMIFFILQTYQSQLISHAQQKDAKYLALSDNSQTNTSSSLSHQNISSTTQTHGVKYSHIPSSSNQDYITELIMLLLSQGLSKKMNRKIDSFYLAADIMEAEMFGDIIFKCKYKDQHEIEKSKIIFLKAKHEENTGKKAITFDKLLSKSKKNAFSLKQCFEFYRKIKQQFLEKGADHPLFGRRFEHTDCDFVIYTNASFASEKTTQNAKSKCVDPDSVLYLKGKPESHCYYELIVNEDNRREIMEVMRDSSDCMQLIKELVNSVLYDEHCNVNLYPEGIFRKYQFALMESVVIREMGQTGRIRNGFLNGNENLSSQDQIFRDAFFEEAVKLTKKTESELKMELGSKCIKFHGDFGIYDQSEKNDLYCCLPSDLVSDLEVEEYFSKLKLFFDQPDADELGEIIHHQIQLVYSVPQSDVHLIYSDVKDKIQRWRKREDSCLTETNRFFQDSLKVSIFFNVPKPTTTFTGRHEDLLYLHNLMQTHPQQVLITGLGGIGKTELAKQYIHSFVKHYDNIVWINAANELTLAVSFYELAKDKAKISTTDEDGLDRGIKHVVSDVYNFFSKRKSLFVFDDCENYKEICEFLPHHSTKFSQKDLYILLTSRYQEWGNEIRYLVLGDFSIKEAKEFVKRKLNIYPRDASQDKDIESFIMKLHCFPLVIDQATTYIEYQKVGGDFGFSDYLRQYEQEAERLLNFEGYDTGCSHHVKSFFASWKITSSKINHDKQHGQIALKILDTISYFQFSINVDYKIFLSLADGNEKQCKSAVKLLTSHSVLNMSKSLNNEINEQKGQLFTIHPIVQQVRRIELKTRGLEEEKLKTVLKLVESHLDKQTASHAIAVWNYASMYEKLVKEFSQLPGQITSTLLDSVRYKEALVLGMKSFKVLTKLLGPLHTDTLAVFTNVTRVLHAQGNYEDTRECLKKIKFILDPCQHEMLIRRTGSEIVPLDQKSYDEVLKIYREIIDKICQNFIIDKSVEIGQPIHQYTKSSTTFVTGMLSSTSIYDDMLKTIEETVDKEKQIWGLHHPSTFSSLTKLAETLFQKGNYCDALKTYKELQNINMHVFGSDHLAALKIENGICEINFARGDYDMAQKMCVRILEKYEQIMGTLHPDTLRTKILLAKILDSRGEFNVAMDICLECEMKCIKIFGSLHPDVLRAKNLIAGIYCKQRNNSKAMEVYQEVFHQFMPILGPDNLDILQTKSGIAKVYFKQRNYEMALGAYCQVFDKQSAILGIEHLDTLFTLSDIHHVLLKSIKLRELFYCHYIPQDICEEYNDMRDICTFEKCCSLLYYWISFSPLNVNMIPYLWAGATMNFPDNFDWHHLGLTSMIAKRCILKYLTEKASPFKVSDKSNFIFICTLHMAVQHGELDIVKTLIEKCSDLNPLGKCNLTPVHIAIQMGHLDIVKYFVLKGIDLNAWDENGLTLLETATHQGKLDIVKYLIEKGADVNVHNKYGLTLLHWASSSGSLPIVKCLVVNGADVNISNSGLTPLHLAVSSGCAEIIKYLVDNGADVSVRHKNGLTLLHTAASAGNVDVFSSLINISDDLSATDVDDLTVLHRASLKGRLDLVKYIVGHGAYVDIQNKNGLTPLHLAAQEGKLSVIQYLMNQKVDYDIQDVHGCTPLHFATNAGKSEVVKYLVHKGADVNAETKDGETVLHKAIRSGCLDTVKYLTEKGANFMKPDINGSTPLEQAVNTCCNNDIIKFLIKAYAKSLSGLLMQDISKCSEHEKSADIHFLTPVYFAVIKGFLDIVEFLVNEDVNSMKYTDKDDSSLLHLAAGKGYLDVVNFLVKNGADINYRNVYGETPLYDAINHNYFNIVKYLSTNGAKLNCVNKRGESPLHRAAFAGFLEIVMYLVDRNVCLDIQDNDGNTPLHYAAKQGNLSLLKYLIGKGACSFTVNTFGKTALHLSVETEEENFNVVKFLVERDSTQTFAVDDNGWTVLHTASYFDHPSIIEFLLEKGANPNVRNDNYEAPLHLASSSSSIDAVKALLEGKANIYARDYEDKTFLDVASPSVQREIESLKDYVDVIGRAWYRNEELLNLLNEPIVVNKVQSHFEREKTDINACTLGNETFLHFASRKGNEELVQMALEKGADIYATTDVAETALHLAARVGNPKVLQLLLDKGVNVNLKNDHWETALHEAARTGNEECVELLFEQDHSLIDKKTAFGNTVLHNAVASRNLKIVEFLLKKDFDINSRNAYGETPLFVAVRVGNEAMVSLLLEKNADIKVRDCYGNTCAHIASMEGNHKVLQLLLDDGAEINSRNFRRETPLHLACNKEAVELLVNSGADVNARTSKLSVHVYAEEGNEDGIRELLSCSPQLACAKDHDDSQPIHILARQGHIDLMKLLLEKGASLDAKDCNGMQPIHLASREGHLNVVLYILAQTGVSHLSEVLDNSGYQPIHLAAREGHTHVVEFILNKNSHLVNSQSACKIVPLHLAARNLHMDVINCLIKRTDCSLVAEDELKQNFLHHFAAGLYSKYKKCVAIVVEHVTKLAVESVKNSVRTGNEDGMASTQSLKTESSSVLSLTNILDSDAMAKIGKIPCFNNVLEYYRNVETLTKEVLNIMRRTDEAEVINDAYSKVQCDVEDIKNNIQENIVQIKEDQSGKQDLEVISHFPRFLLLTLHITLLKFMLCLKKTHITQQIHEKEALLANYSIVLNNYSNFVSNILNVSKEKYLNIVDEYSVYVRKMKDALEKLENSEHSDSSNEISDVFYNEKIKYYVEKAQPKVLGVQDERMKAIQRLATQRSLQIIGDKEAIKHLESKLHVDSTTALKDLRNNYLSHSTKRNHLYARVLSEYRPEVFNVACDLSVILKLMNGKLKEGLKLEAIQTLSDDLRALSEVDSSLMEILKKLNALQKECKKQDHFLSLETTTGEIHHCHERRQKLKLSSKEKFNGIDNVCGMIDDYFNKVLQDYNSGNPRWVLYLAVPFFERRLMLLKDVVLKESCIEKHLRQGLSFTVNQKPEDRIMLCLRNNEQLLAAMEFLIFDLRSILTDTLKESNMDFHKKMRKKVNDFIGYPWLRNHLAHLSHGSPLCHGLTDFSKVFASDACMFMEKGKLIPEFIKLSFKMHQNRGEFIEDGDTKWLFNHIGQSSHRVEFLQALKEFANVEALEGQTEKFISSFSDLHFKKMLKESKQTGKFLKLLQEFTKNSKTGILEGKIILFFRNLAEQEFTDELLRLLQDEEYLKTVQDIIGFSDLRNEVVRYIERQTDFRKVIEFVHFKEFFIWLKDLVKDTLPALEALQKKVERTVNVLKSREFFDEMHQSGKQYLTNFSEDLKQIISSHRVTT